MATQWLRLWHDMPNDPKWRTIARVSGQSISKVIAVYLHLLVNASNANERGRTQNICNDDIASALDIGGENVAAIIEAMQGRVLEGEKITGWEKRQPSREDGAAERAKAWRERKRTQTNASEPPDKDKDKDKEEKIIYAANVKMTKSEHDKLLESHGPQKTAWMIEKLNVYKGSNGKKYKSDYLAILNWVVGKAAQEFVAPRGKKVCL
jgi:hypothetical protein